MSATANGVDPALVTRIVDKVKAQGIFDQFRRDCLADVDTKPAYQNLGSRVEGYVSTFLSKFTWTSDMNKNQLRNTLRRQINESEMLASGVERIIEQVVDAQIQHRFLPRIEAVVKEYLHSGANPPSASNADAKPVTEGIAQAAQQGTSGASSSPMLPGIKSSPADSPLVSWSAATAALKSTGIPPQPPPLPGESEDQPKPPPLPETSISQEKPAPPPLPRSREASPPPLPPSSVPERKRTPSISSTPSLDSISSDPLSESDDERPKTVVKAAPKISPATSTPPGKVVPGKRVLVKKRISIVKKVVVRKADGTKVVRVIRMDPNKATAKKLLMKAAARQAGDQATSTKGTAVSNLKGKAAIPTGDIKNEPEIEAMKAKEQKPLADDAGSGSGMTAHLGKRKHSSSSASFMDTELSRVASKTSEVPSPSSLRQDDQLPLREAKLIKQEPSTPEDSIKHEADAKSPVDDILSKDLEDVSSPGSTTDLSDSESEAEQKPVKDEEEKEGFFPDDVSESDSHVSDVTVSSVHTSDLSSFDERISSSSSSSSSSEDSGGEEETDDYSAKQVKQPESTATAILPTMLDVSTESSSELASSSSVGRNLPYTEGARWRREHMIDTEDEASRAARRRRAVTKAWIRHHHQEPGSIDKAEAKEERARRRQQMKEEREKEHEEDHSGEGMRPKRLRRDHSPPENKLSKQQMKEQKLQEKRREAKRQRTLLSQSDDSSVPTNGAMSSPLRKIRSLRRSEAKSVTTYRQEFYLKKRKPSQIPFHYLLSLDLAHKVLLKKSQQRAKLLQVRAKEEKEGKKPHVRFACQLSQKKKPSRWQVEAERRKQRLLEDAGDSKFATQLPGSCVDDVADRTQETEIADIMDTVDVPKSGDADVKEVADSDNIVDAEKATVAPGGNSPNHSPLNDGEDQKPTEKADASEDENMEVNISASPKVAADFFEEGPLSCKDSNDTTTMQSKEKSEECKLAEEQKPDAVEEMETSTGNGENLEDTKEESDTKEPCDSKTVGSQKDLEIKEEGQNQSTEGSSDVENKDSESKGKESQVTQEECKVSEIEDSPASPENLKDRQVVVKEDEGKQDQCSEGPVESDQKEEVPTFIVLEREEISSDESELEEMAANNEKPGSSESEVPKLPSIFQQTEAISSDEELDDIVPPAGSKAEKVKEGDVVEARSEGEVEEGALPEMEEMEPITKLTEDISGDEFSDVQSIDNPPTPTMDEPAEHEGLEEESLGEKPAIPIVVKGKGLGTSSGSSSDAERREGTPKEEEGSESSKVSKKAEEMEEGEFEEGEVPDVEEGEFSEETEPRNTRGARQTRSSNQGPPEDTFVYGKRSRRRTFSPHHTKDEDYYFFGLPKRSRHESPTTQSPASPPPDSSQKKMPMRERTRSGGTASRPTQDPTAADSGKEPDDTGPTAIKERRSSRHNRRVSPPHRYSPSEQRTSTKGKRQAVPPSPVPSVHEPTPSPPAQQQPHRHFTRRMSGRDEERRPHRYEDMYYYDNKRPKAGASSTPASSKPTRRTSAEEKKRKR